jgi:hypothetical protein
VLCQVRWKLGRGGSWVYEGVAGCSQAVTESFGVGIGGWVGVGSYRGAVRALPGFGMVRKGRYLRGWKGATSSRFTQSAARSSSKTVNERLPTCSILK